MSEIKSYNDLLAERERMENLLSVQKHQMKANWGDLKLELAPVGSAYGVVKKLFKRDRSNPVLNFGINILGDMVIKKVLLAKADWVSRLFLPLFFKNFSSHALNRGRIRTKTERIRSWFQRDQIIKESTRY